MKTCMVLDVETVSPSLSCLPEMAGDRDPATFGATSIFMAEIVCVGMQTDEKPDPFVILNHGAFKTGTEVLPLVDCFSYPSEAEALDFANQRFAKVHRFSGWNIRGFDLPILHNRMIRHGIRPCNALVMACKESRYYPDKCFDLMDLTTFFSRRVSLREAAIGLLSKDPKANGNGADVAGLVRDGKVEELVRYCLGDVEITREIYERWVG